MARRGSALGGFLVGFLLSTNPEVHSSACKGSLPGPSPLRDLCSPSQVVTRGGVLSCGLERRWGKAAAALTCFASPDVGGVFGRVPQSVVDDEECLLLTDHESSLDLQSLRRVAENAHKQYLKSRPSPSPESIKRSKELDFSQLGIHPLFSEYPPRGQRTCKHCHH